MDNNTRRARYFILNYIWFIYIYIWFNDVAKTIKSMLFVYMYMPIIVPNCNEIIVKLSDLYKNFTAKFHSSTYIYNKKLKDLLV